MLFTLSAHGALLKISDGSAARVAGRYPEILRWLCGGPELSSGAKDLAAFARVLADSANDTNEPIALTLPEAPHAERATRLATALAAAGPRLGLIAARTAIAGLNDAWSPNGSIHWLLDSRPDALLLTKLDPASATPAIRVRLDFSEAAFLQRQAVRDCFVTEAGIRLTDLGVNDDHIEQWLDEKLLSSVTSGPVLLEFNLPDGRTAEISAATLRARLNHLSKDWTARLLHGWPGGENDVLAVEGWLGQRFGIRDEMARMGDERHIEFGINQQEDLLNYGRSALWRSDEDHLVLVASCATDPVLFPSCKDIVLQEHSGNERFWRRVAISSTLLSTVLLALMVLLLATGHKDGLADRLQLQIDELNARLLEKSQELNIEQTRHADELQAERERLVQYKSRAAAESEEIRKKLAEYESARATTKPEPPMPDSRGGRNDFGGLNRFDER